MSKGTFLTASGFDTGAGFHRKRKEAKMSIFDEMAKMAEEDLARERGEPLPSDPAKETYSRAEVDELLAEQNKRIADQIEEGVAAKLRELQHPDSDEPEESEEKDAEE